MNVLKSSIYLVITMLAFTILSNNSSAQFRTQGRQNSLSTSSNLNQRYYYTNGMIGEAIIEADRDSRSIIVITDEQTNEHIAEIIKNLDRPVQQVLIKVVFLEVTYRNDSDIGIEGSIDINNSQDGSGGIFQTAFGLAAESRGGFYQILEDDLNITMRAITERGKLEVLSRPSILTRNNQEAVITVGNEVPFITSSQITNQGQTINTIQYRDIGIILRVTPFITKEGLVELILAPEISTISDKSVPISETVTSPVFAKRSADTVVVSPSGKTVVIGGMMEDNNTEVTNKIPILGDIPILGWAFKRKEQNKTKTELLIFLTPYVVAGPSEIVKMSQRENNYSELAPQAFSEHQLNKYIDNLPQASDTQTSVGESAKEKEIIIESKPTRLKRKRNSKGRVIR